MITVRTGSSRLPQKALLEIRGKSTIEHLIERTKLVKGADIIILCTSVLPEDNILEDIARKNGIACYRGPLKDKILRLLGAVEEFGLDYFVTLDGDDTFCDPELIDLSIDQMLADPCDVIKNPPDLVCGSFTFCISADALRKACTLKDTDDTDMFEVYLIESGRFNVRDLKVDDPIFHNPKIRMTLDYQEDLDLFKRIFEEFNTDSNTIPLRDIIALINRKPSIAEINLFRHEDYEKKRDIMRSRTLIKKGA